MQNREDIKGLYNYIVNNYEDSDIVSLTRKLINYTKGKEDNDIIFPTTILELAVREEVKYVLMYLKDNRLEVLPSWLNKKITNKIAYEIVYKNESLWENFNELVLNELESILIEIESKSE